MTYGQFEVAFGFEDPPRPKPARTAVLTADQARRQKALWHLTEACRLIGTEALVGLRVAVGVNPQGGGRWYTLQEVLDVLAEFSGRPPARWADTDAN